MNKVLTIGEAMGLLIAEEMGPLEEVEHFSRHVCGAELNYAVGMARLGNDVSYISKVGVDPFGKCICNFLKANGIHDDYVWTDDDHMTGFQMKEKSEKGIRRWLISASIRPFPTFSRPTFPVSNGPASTTCMSRGFPWLCRNHAGKRFIR